MGQVYVPPDDARTGHHPVRTVTTPSTATTDPNTEQQVVTPAGADGTLQAIMPWGAARVAAEPIPLFEDMLDAGAVDTIDRWTTGGTVPPVTVNSAGRLMVSPATTTASASSSLTSKPFFQPEQVVAETANWVAQFEAGPVTGSHRFMGFGTQPTTWLAAYSAGTSGPIQDGYGFELDTDGLMYAVVYQNASRFRVTPVSGAANLSVGRTLGDNQFHRFSLLVRGDVIYWYIDDLTTPAAQLSYTNTGWVWPPAITNLPLRFHTINGTAAPAAAPWLQLLSVGVNESSEQGICDPVFPWREPRVTDPNAIANAQQYAASAKTAGAALNVNTNAVQLATYKLTMKPSAAALTANTLSLRCSLHHLATSTKTVRIRRIEVTGLMTAVAEASQIEVHRVTAAPIGTAVIAGTYTVAGSYVPTNPADPNPEATALNSLTTATSIGLLTHGFLTTGGAALHGGGETIYDYDADSQMKPITLRAGVLEGIAIGILASAAVTPTLTVEITFTEE